MRAAPENFIPPPPPSLVVRTSYYFSGFEPSTPDPSSDYFAPRAPRARNPAPHVSAGPIGIITFLPRVLLKFMALIEWPRVCPRLWLAFGFFLRPCDWPRWHSDVDKIYMILNLKIPYKRGLKSFHRARRAYFAFFIFGKNPGAWWAGLFLWWHWGVELLNRYTKIKAE